MSTANDTEPRILRRIELGESPWDLTGVEGESGEGVMVRVSQNRLGDGLPRPTTAQNNTIKYPGSMFTLLLLGQSRRKS